METNRLRQFHILYQTGNLRKASELLGISHSGLSKSMSTLEGEIGASLYLQAGRGITFTDRAHKLANELPLFFNQLDQLMLSESSGQNKILKIGSFEVFTTYFAKSLGPLLDDYDLDFHELLPGRMEKALIDREIDVAITYEPIAIPGVEHLKVTTIDMAMFVGKGAFSGTAFLDIPFAAPVIPNDGAATGIKGLDGWPDHKIKRNIRYRVDLMETAISLARNGHCAVFIPSFVARLHNKIVKDEFQLIRRNPPKGLSTITRDVYIVKRESTVEDSKIKKIAKYLRRL